jgi:hypothetical protein
MTHDDLCEALSLELEQEYSKRIYEITQIENFFRLNSASTSEELSGIVLKSLIILLYAHFEGFCKKALKFYVIYINKMETFICDVKYGIAAASLHEDFEKLLNDRLPPPKKINGLHSDGLLWRHYRRSEFLLNYETCLKNLVKLKDDFIDAKSILEPKVLKNLLYQLDLDYTCVDLYAGDIHKLIYMRNDFAHRESALYPLQCR